MADAAIFEFSGKTTVCHIKQWHKCLLPIDLILRQAPRVQAFDKSPRWPVFDFQ